MDEMIERNGHAMFFGVYLALGVARFQRHATEIIKVPNCELLKFGRRETRQRAALCASGFGAPIFVSPRCGPGARQPFL